MKTLAFFLSLSTIALAACGTSTLGGNGGGGGGGGHGGGGDSGLCGGKPSPLSCTDTSCPDGYACVPDVDPTTCHPSNCACDASGDWACTDDCGMGGSTCRQLFCGGELSPVTCEKTGCPDGYTCTPDPDPMSACHPSGCDCDEASSSWLCTADCGTGSTCVQGL